MTTTTTKQKPLNKHCAWCGDSLLHLRVGARFCSISCGARWRHSGEKENKKHCGWCGGSSAHADAALDGYCSTECKANASKVRNPKKTRAFRRKISLKNNPEQWCLPSCLYDESQNYYTEKPPPAPANTREKFKRRKHPTLKAKKSALRSLAKEVKRSQYKINHILWQPPRKAA